MPARRVCAWCRKVMTEGTEPTTHGICAACEAKIRREELGGDSQGEGGENAEARRIGCPALSGGVPGGDKEKHERRGCRRGRVTPPSSVRSLCPRRAVFLEKGLDFGRAKPHTPDGRSRR